MLRFQPGIAAMYACTGASPSALAICGLPPDRSFTGFASLAPGLAIGGVPAVARDLDLVALDRILGDDHTVITKDGSVLTKAQEMANYKSETSSNELFDLEPVSLRHSVLLSAGTDHRVHRPAPSSKGPCCISGGNGLSQGYGAAGR